MKYCILGFGVSGILVCLELLAAGVQVSEICCIDPYFDGGSLGRKWGSIQSNTTWGQIHSALERYPTAHGSLKRVSLDYSLDQTVPLSLVQQILRECIQPFVSTLKKYQTKCKKIQEIESGQWRCFLTSGDFLDVETIFLCHGGKPKQEDYAKPMIPLEVAFEKSKLQRYIQVNEVIGIFGSAHSGTIAAKNVVESGGEVYLFHKYVTPFHFARDGAYDGVKKESEEIADAIVSKKGIGEKIHLVYLGDGIESIKAITKCTWIIQCIGFKRNEVEIKTLEGDKVKCEDYDAQTAEILHGKSLYGFGLGYPGKTTIGEKTYVDISIPSFLEQITKCLPAVFTKKQ